MIKLLSIFDFNDIHESKVKEILSKVTRASLKHIYKEKGFENCFYSTMEWVTMY